MYELHYYVHYYEGDTQKITHFTDSLANAKLIKQKVLRCYELYKISTDPYTLISDEEETEYDNLMTGLGLRAEDAHMLPMPVRIYKVEKTEITE